MSTTQNDPFHLSKWFLEYLGLWPGQSKLRRNIGLITFLATSISIIIPQVLATLMFEAYKKIFLI